MDGQVRVFQVNGFIVNRSKRSHCGFCSTWGSLAEARGEAESQALRVRDELGCEASSRRKRCSVNTRVDDEGNYCVYVSNAQGVVLVEFVVSV